MAIILPPQLKIAAGLSLICAGFFILIAVYRWGYSNASTAYELRAEERETALLKQVHEAQQKLLATERGHAAAVAAIQADYERRAQEQAAQDAAVIADLRSSRERVRVKVTDCDDPAVPAVATPARPPAGTRTAELDSETAARIWAIAADGQRAVEKLNALQAWAREAVELCR